MVHYDEDSIDEPACRNYSGRNVTCIDLVTCPDCVRYFIQQFKIELHAPLAHVSAAAHEVGDAWRYTATLADGVGLSAFLLKSYLHCGYFHSDSNQPLDLPEFTLPSLGLFVLFVQRSRDLASVLNLAAIE